ncbi:MAG: metal ABC transporter substrate-binding protein [Candidatus Eremiobacteraeota bacterium]|nr:metal ABC transporter substrate-binding protein [Candidatus Eremiobacteraeota bacterium]
MILDKAKRFSFLVLLIAIAGCSRTPAGQPSASSSGRPVVVTTTSTFAALVRSVGDDTVTVHALVPVGVSPETYEPTPQDITELGRAALIVENGAGLETWLDKLIKSAAPNARVLVLSSVIPRAQAINPHYWLDPNYAELYVAEIAHALARIDPPNAARYRSNAAAELNRLSELDRWIRRQIATIPPNRRAMITFHDAWYYFDRRYGLRDVGAIEPSPGREPSAGELAALIATARANGVRAIFGEPEFSPKLAKQLADGAGITTVTSLYDDSLGTTPDLSTYEGMMRHDVDTIVQALRS